jgi:hypothetical protein
MKLEPHAPHAPHNPSRCPHCGRRHLQIVPFSAAELAAFDEEDFVNLDYIGQDPCKLHAWLERWRARRTGGEVA